MRKVWVTKRKGIPGQYVEWYDDSGRRRSKYFQPEFKKYITAFKARKFSELNADVRPIGSVIDISWTAFKEQYLKEKEVEGLAEKSISEIKNTFNLFNKYCPTASTGTRNRISLNNFITALQKRDSNRLDKAKCTKNKKVYVKLSPNTINKHIRNFRAIVNWGVKHRYIAEMEIKNVKADDKQIRILSNREVKELLLACGNDKQWKMRILMGVCTGLRRSDLDRLELRNVDVERKTVSVVNKKTGKVTNYQPLPDALMPEIERFILEEVVEGQVRLFKFKFSKKWETIRKRAGLSDIEFHDLRRTFGSMQADAGVPIKALQEMYNHANIETTMKHYIRTDESEKRNGVNKLKVQEWL